MGFSPFIHSEYDQSSLAGTCCASVVAPAQGSPNAVRKAVTRRTDDGDPGHSFQTLLQDLGTVARNRLRLASGDETDLLTTPTPLQEKALGLLGVRLPL